MGYNFLEHTADVKFRAEGPTLERMFNSAAEALFEVMKGKIVVPRKFERCFEVKGGDNEELLYNFLEEFLFLLDAEGFVPSKIKSLKMSDKKIVCVVFGDKADSYGFTNEVKAITYNGMFVRRIKKNFICEVVLDV